MHNLSPEVQSFVQNVHQDVHYWLKRDYPDIDRIFHQIKLNSQQDANEHGYNEYLSNLCGHNSDIELAAVRNSFRRAGDNYCGNVSKDNSGDVDFITHLLNVVFKDHANSVSEYDRDLPVKIAIQSEQAKKTWFDVSLYILIAMLRVNGVAANIINALLECCRELSTNPDCVSILRNAPELSDLTIFIAKEAAVDPLYTAKVSTGDFDAVHNRSPGDGDGNRLDGGHFNVCYSDPTRYFANKLRSKREQQFQNFINNQRCHKDKFYKEIDPQTASIDWNKTIAAQFPFFRSIGLFVPHYNASNVDLPYMLIPGLVVSYTPIKSVNNKTNTNTNDQKDNDDDDDDDDDEDITITTKPSNSQADFEQSHQYLFVTYIKQNYLNLSKQHMTKDSEILNDTTIDLTSDHLSKNEWDAVRNIGPSAFNNPKLYGIPLYLLHNDDPSTLVGRLKSDGSLQYSEWDIVQLSKKNHWTVYHTHLKNIHVNYAIHFEGYENKYPSINFSHFISSDNNNIPLQTAFPDIIHIKDPLRFFAKPEVYPHPPQVKAIWCNDFVDGIQTQHSSALAPSITMVQTRMVNGDLSDIINTGMTFHSRGLNPILAGHSRVYLGLSTMGRLIQYFDLDIDALVWGYVWGTLVMLHVDRPELSNVSHKSAATSVNPGPKSIGLFPDRVPYQHWKNEKHLWNYAIDFYKSQRLINNTKKFIETFRAMMSNALQNRIISAVGIGKQILQQPSSRMPGIATGDLINAEPSHMLLSGITQRINNFLIKMVERDSKIRFHILSMSYNNTFKKPKAKYYKYTDFVSLTSGKYAKSAWKFYRNYHLCLNLRLILMRFSSSCDNHFVSLIESVHQFLCAISYLWGPTFGNKLRRRSEKLYDEFMDEWSISSCDPNQVFDENGVKTMNKKTKRVKQKTTKEHISDPNNIENLEKLKKFIAANANKFSHLNSNEFVKWNEKMQEQEKNKKQEQQKKKDEDRGRTSLKTSKHFENTAAVIATANFQYARELFLDSYICGSASILSSMSFEASLSKNKNAVQHDTWINIHNMLPRIGNQLSMKRRFNSMLVDIVDLDKHSRLVNVLPLRVQRKIHVATLQSKIKFDFGFDQKIPWISCDVWNKYYWRYYLPYAKQQCMNHKNIYVNKDEYCVSPLDCPINKSKFKDSGIKQIHECLIILIAEYSLSSTNQTDLVFCIKSLSNKYIDVYLKYSDQIIRSQYQTNMYVLNHNKKSIKLQWLINAITDGKIKLATRRITKLNISRGSVDDCSITAGDWIWCYKRLLVDMDTKYHVVIRIVKIIQFKNLKYLLPTLPIQYIPFNVVILGEVWKAPVDCKSEWDDDIDDVNMGNFVHVQEGAMPTFQKCYQSNGNVELTVIFGADVISKLYPASKCKPLHEQQYKNFYCKTTNTSKDNQIYYYAFNQFENWHKDGGCVVVPQCTHKKCKKFGCNKHLVLTNEPTKFRHVHLCGYDWENRVCLLSHRQMIVNSFLKTGSTKPVHTACECVDDDESVIYQNMPFI